jgi:hypothetical protein
MRPSFIFIILALLTLVFAVGPVLGLMELMRSVVPGERQLPAHCGQPDPSPNVRFGVATAIG